MPCQSDHYGCSHDETFRELDRVTDMLCTMLKGHKGQLPANISEWWARHQALDARRKAEKEAAAKEKAEKKAALAKLSPKEKKMLGIYRDE